ncbi:ABC transporter permease [Mangrovactinospora gilvigrisea]|uniref:ABC transporter permease n=1 Tax=Mangrovactinospora gilvigrisea TaxID=1428644 RepID=A0A1J7BW10_9ACTN|nr:ABC-2 family transporter protein [Mangrovactinospora gilvigrisea]OIV37649.1 ABC transporter permease [Mangrovactinospora gilvigrisea]
MATVASNPVPAHRQYLLLLHAAWRGQLQYRGNLVLTLIGGVLYQGVGLAFVWAVVAKFGHVGGWGMGELAFLYGVRLTAHAAWTIPFNRLNSMDWMVQRGEFDRYLIRPAGTLTQFLNWSTNIQPLGDLIGGVGVLVAASSAAPIDWSPTAVLYLLATIAGGALVECSLQLGLCGLSFRLQATYALRMNFIDNIMNNFGGYPLTIFPSVMRFALTFLLPLAFVAYLPANVLLHRTGELSVAPWLAWCAPLLGPLLFAAAYKFWYGQLKHYKSSGT